LGHVVEAKCHDCGSIFTVKHGGGFSFHLVRCDKCGKTRSVSFDDLGELHLRYLKGLQGPHPVEISVEDGNLQNQVLEPISEDEYHRGIDAIAGRCRYRGKYMLDAPPRCPKCRSTHIAEGETTIMYD
jgi:hypothetical protein